MPSLTRLPNLLACIQIALMLALRVPASRHSRRRSLNVVGLTVYAPACLASQRGTSKIVDMSEVRINRNMIPPFGGIDD